MRDSRPGGATFSPAAGYAGGAVSLICSDPGS